MANLSTEQLLFLNNLMYMSKKEPLSPITSYPAPCTVEDIINAVSSRDFNDTLDYGSYMTGAEWKQMINAIRADAQLMQITLVDTHTDKAAGGGKGVSALFADPSTGEAVVVFRGTAANEWKDNFVAGAEVSSAQQENALDWYQSLNLSEYSNVTVTGHSKGGNKAKYITIMDDSVDRCVSFDGQGFSDEFMEENQSQIALNQEKIENHNVNYDYVNMLLNDVGSITFYEGQQIAGLVDNHSPNSFFDFSNGDVRMHITDRPPEMEALDQFLNSYLRSLPEEDKKKVLDIIGEIVQILLGGGKKEDILKIVFDGNNEDYILHLIAYMGKYIQEYPEFAEYLEDLLDRFDMQVVAAVIDGLEKVLNSWVMDGRFADIQINKDRDDRTIGQGVSGTVDFKVDIVVLEHSIIEIERQKQRLEMYEDKTRAVMSKLKGTQFLLRTAVGKCADGIDKNVNVCAKMSQCLTNIKKAYIQTEEQCVKCV